MALGTPTIEALRGEREESLARLREGVSGNIEELQGAARRNYDALLNDVRTLDGLKDTSFQIAAYGEERWKNDFIRVRDLKGGVHNPTWKRVAGSRLGRFQTIYCDPDDWVVPSVPRGDLNTMSLKGCLVRGDKIPDAFALSAGFIDREQWEEFNDDPIGRLAQKQHWTEPMKALYESTVPVGASKRMRRIEPRPDNVKKMYADIPEHREAANGDLLLMKHKNGNDGPRTRELHHYTDGDSLMRMTHHQERGHGSETDFLQQCEIDLEGLILELDQRYRKGTPAQEKALLWEKAQTTMARYNRRLEHCFNELKIEASGFLLSAADIEEGKTVRITPAMTKITAARRRLKNRPDEMRDIEQHNMSERSIMFANLRREKHALRAFHGKIAAIPDAREEAMKFGATRTQANDVARTQLETASTQLTAVKMNPMRGIARTLYALTWTLTPENEEAFDDQLLTMHMLGKLHELNMALDELRFDCALTGRLDFAHALTTAKAIEKEFTTRQMFPKRDAKVLQELIEPLNAQLDILRTRLEFYVANPPAEDDAEKIRDSFKLYLDTIDVSSTVGAIELRIPKPQYANEQYTLQSSK